MQRYYVSSNKKITPSTLLLTLKKDPSSSPISFDPGQYTAISFKRNGRPTPTRCFSIVNSPTESEILQCSIRTKGKFTNALSGLITGQEVKVRGSFGRFTFNSSRDKDAVLVAGGIGVAPFMSMIRYATDNKLGNKITLIYSNSSQDDVPFLDDLNRLEKQNPNFRVIFVVTRGAVDKLSNQKVITGRLTSEQLEAVLVNKFDNKSYFICGPSQFMNAIHNILTSEGVSNTVIFTESFSQGFNIKNAKKRGWPFYIYVVGAAGFIATSLTIAVNDLIANTKSVTPNTTPAVVKPTCVTNTRQDDLEELYDDDSRPPVNCTNTTTTTTNTTTTTTPKCTTTQSGVTTCV